MTDAVLELLLLAAGDDGRLVVADEAVDLLDLGAGDHVDLRVCLHLLQKPRQVLLGVEALEGVVELAVVAAEFLFLLHDVGLEALVGQRQGRRDAGQSAADDEGVVIHAQLARLEGLQELRLGDGHAHEVLGLLGGLDGLVHVDPGVLVADVGHLEEVAVEARLLAVLLEESLVGARRAGAHDDAGQIAFP